MKKRKIISKILTYAFLIVVGIFTVFPLFYTLMASFKTNIEIMTAADQLFPKQITFENYAIVWNSGDFNAGRLFFNSALYTFTNVFINLFLAVSVGYVFAIGRFRLKKLIFLCFSSLMFIKSGGIGIYATFQILDFLHIPRNLYTLIGLSAFGIPIIYIYLARSYILSIPYGIAESAKIDGCGFCGILYKVYLPMLKPLLATITILSFNGFWNDYLTPTYYTATKPMQRTLMVGLMSLKNSDAATNWNLLLAGSFIALLPVLVIYAFCSRFFVQGISAGAIKG